MFLSPINSYRDHHRLALKLRPIPVGELHLARKLNHPVYIFQEGKFIPVISEGSVPSKDQINNLIQAKHREVYLYGSDLDQIKTNLESALIKVTRSLSVGDPLESGAKGMKLLSLNMGSLYQNPHNDESLRFHFQSSQNLGKFFIENKKDLPYFFHQMRAEKFHFTLSQPMLSSVLLLAFLQATRLFHEKEIEALFLTSYFKDIGVSMISKTKYDLKTLTPRDKELFSSHADFSFDLLQSRVPLSKNYLNIIKHHHFLNDRIKVLAGGQSTFTHESEMILGLESTLVAVFDIMVAMTHDRPYRKGISLYQSLEVIKKLMADEYPQEYKALIIFMKQFFKN
jgi:HD-GYP domain-containing protein (c-di-GMP phosphodiesterase class II)